MEINPGQLAAGEQTFAELDGGLQILVGTARRGLADGVPPAAVAADLWGGMASEMTGEMAQYILSVAVVRLAQHEPAGSPPDG